MQKILKLLTVSLLLMVAFTKVAYAEDIKNFNDLVEQAKNYDGKKITVKGEAIGEQLKRGDYSWVNINDGNAAIGIWMKNEDANKVKTYGNYKQKGDTIEVEGTFNRACAEHGGDLDIHADKVTVTMLGEATLHPISKGKKLSSVIFTAVCLALAVPYIKMRKK